MAMTTICDTCGKVKENNLDALVTWWTINGPPPDEDGDPRYMAFCSDECLKDWIELELPI
jgi:hypothetical protein